MAHITGQILIDRPVAEVFDFVADERNEPRYNPQMVRAEKTSPGPVGPGSTFRARAVNMGRPVEMVIETTAYDRPRRLASSTTLSSMTIDGTLTFEPQSEGTLMRWHWDVRPRGVLKLLSPIVARLGRRQEQAVWTGLKELLESE
jgi:Polyketide cyclase / dehydrase and lipid transport